MFPMDVLQLSCWVLPGVVAYWAIGCISAGSVSRKEAKHPPLSKMTALIPTWILNIIFAIKATDLLQVGYEKVGGYYARHPALFR